VLRVLRVLVTAAVVATAASAAQAEPGHDSSPNEPVQPPPPVDTVTSTAPEPARPAGQRLSPRTDVVMASVSTIHNDAFSVSDLRLKAAMPVARGNHYGVALMLNYDATKIEMPEMAGTDLTLHRFEAMLGGGTAVAPDWSLRGSFGVSHSSDLVDSTWGAIAVTSSAMLHHVISPSDAIVFGVAYTSTAQVFPVLPLLGYVHQRAGSPFRLDVFLPHHVRAEYELARRWRGALGLEAAGDTWTVHLARTRGEQLATREGGAVFAELSLAATDLIHIEARAGLSVDQYALPTPMDGMVQDQPLRASSFAQLLLVVAP
jgi:hypothetical protein